MVTAGDRLFRDLPRPTKALRGRRRLCTPRLARCRLALLAESDCVEVSLRATAGSAPLLVPGPPVAVPALVDRHWAGSDSGHPGGCRLAPSVRQPPSSSTG